MPKNIMPPGWEPPFPAWQSVWRDTNDPLLTAYFGIQAKQPALLEHWATPAFSSQYAPLSLERGSYVDQSGVKNYLYIAYWRLSEYQRWWSLEGNSGWWANRARLSEDAGYWREIVVMQFDRFETLHSVDEPHGVGVSADGMDGPMEEHGYSGAMRDRIPLSAEDDMKEIASIHTPLQAQVKDGGARVLVVPPENMCVIRSGQNWSFCEAEEKAYYLEHLYPALLEGMHYLRDNPAESNCYSLRFVDNKDQAWGCVEQSFGLGYSTDIYAFENWAREHPTHLAIFGNFMQMVETFGEELKLRLWHEVTVLQKDDCEFEYIGCHPKTGLLGYI